MNEDQRHLMPQILNFLNVLAKNALQASDYKQIGRLPKYFVESDKRVIADYQLEMWPGYLATTRLVRDGIFLNVDTVSKFIQQTTVLDFINGLLEKGWDKEQIAGLFDSSNPDMPRKTVMTGYNVKTYQVDGLDWKRTPKNSIIEASRKVKTGGLEKYKTNLVDYMKTVYNKAVSKPD